MPAGECLISDVHVIRARASDLPDDKSALLLNEPHAAPREDSLNIIDFVADRRAVLISFPQLRWLESARIIIVHVDPPLRAKEKSSNSTLKK